MLSSAGSIKRGVSTIIKGQKMDYYCYSCNCEILYLSEVTNPDSRDFDKPCCPHCESTSVTKTDNTEETTVEFVHTSMMTEPEKVEYILVDGVWQTKNPNSPLAANKFKKDEIDSLVYWS